MSFSVSVTQTPERLRTNSMGSTHPSEKHTWASSQLARVSCSGKRTWREEEKKRCEWEWCQKMVVQYFFSLLLSWVRGRRFGCTALYSRWIEIIGQFQPFLLCNLLNLNCANTKSLHLFSGSKNEIWKMEEEKIAQQNVCVCADKCKRKLLNLLLSSKLTTHNHSRMISCENWLPWLD